MNRRAGLAAILATAAGAASPLRAFAAGRVPTVGYLSGGSDGKDLARALAGVGRVEGRDLRLIVRVGRDDLPGAAAGAADELVRAAPDVLVTYTSVRTLALMRATRTIPIVCGGVGDPVAYGLARSLARPGYNVTGLSNNAVEAIQLLAALLRVALPGLERMVLVRHPADPLHAAGLKSFDAAMQGARLQGAHQVASDQAQVEAALAPRRDVAREAVMLMAPREVDRRKAAQVAIGRRLALVQFGDDEFVEEGGLMSLAHDYTDRMRRVAELTEKILRGADPARMPFELPDRTHLSINRATAAAIGLALPEQLLLRATRVVG